MLDVAVVVEADLADDVRRAVRRRSTGRPIVHGHSRPFGRIGRCAGRRPRRPLAGSRGCGRRVLARRRRRRRAARARARRGEHRGRALRPRRRASPTRARHGQVVEVVAEVGDAVEPDAALVGPVAQRGGLVVAPPWRTRRRASRRAAPTTGFVSVDRISTGTPAARSRATPVAVDCGSRARSRARAGRRCTVSSVCTPSKSVTTASTSIARPSHGARASGASARASSSVVGVSISIAWSRRPRQVPTRPKKRCAGANGTPRHPSHRTRRSRGTRLAVLPAGPVRRRRGSRRRRRPPASRRQRKPYGSAAENTMSNSPVATSRMPSSRFGGSMNGDVAWRNARTRTSAPCVGERLRARAAARSRNVAVSPASSAGRRDDLRAPLRAACGDPSSSVETTTRSTRSRASAAATARATSGTPPTRRRSCPARLSSRRAPG